MILNDARILTLAHAERSSQGSARRGQAMRDLAIIERGAIEVIDGRIAAVHVGDAPTSALRAHGEEVYDMGGRVVMPAFTDCHTHACFAGERYDEMELRLRGESYLNILAAGGGIMSSVRAVRGATQTELVENLRARIALMRRTGTAHIEVKSGYGLELDAELRMLRAIRAVAASDSGIITPTFLGAHAIDGEAAHYCAMVEREMLPAVVREFGAIACDGYCEKSAWSREATLSLLRAAKVLGCPLRVHVDQFNELGMLEDALALGMQSVDHLEATSSASLQRVAQSNAIAVLLPGSGLSLDLRFADGRALLDGGGAVSIASNMNPGSSALTSMPLVIALAARFFRFTHAEAITAACWNSACVLGIESETGSIEVGKRADMIVLPTRDERALAYEWCSVSPIATIVHGRVHAGSLRD